MKRLHFTRIEIIVIGLMSFAMAYWAPLLISHERNWYATATFAVLGAMGVALAMAIEKSYRPACSASLNPDCSAGSARTRLRINRWHVHIIIISAIFGALLGVSALGAHWAAGCTGAILFAGGATAACALLEALGLALYKPSQSTNVSQSGSEA